jgi:hypothetical protein
MTLTGSWTCQHYGCLMHAYTIPAEFVDPTPTAAGMRTYSDIDSLHMAFVTAGGRCPDFFAPKLVNGLPKAMGKCGTESGAATMYLFSTVEDRDQLVEINRATAPVAKLPINLVVGDWWVLESPEAAKVAKEPGGTLVDKLSSHRPPWHAPAGQGVEVMPELWPRCSWPRPHPRTRTRDFLSDTSTSSWCVCQFRHTGEKPGARPWDAEGLIRKWR